MHVHTVPPEDATGLVREFYDEDLADDGYISNRSRLYSLKPEVLAAWRTLIGSIRDTTGVLQQIAGFDGGRARRGAGGYGPPL